MGGTQLGSRWDTGEWAYSAEDMGQRLGGTFADSLLTFGLTNLPAAAHNINRSYSALAAAGEARLLAGEMPSQDQLRAMGMGESEARGLLAVLGMDSPENTAGTEKSGVVAFKAPKNATPEQIAYVKAYVDGCNEALRAGKLSKSGRVSTKGSLRTFSSRAARKEARRAKAAGTPYKGVVGHVPDTTWTGSPEPYFWMDLDPIVNSSLGGQANRYPLGYKPTGFIFEEDRE